MDLLLLLLFGTNMIAVKLISTIKENIIIPFSLLLCNSKFARAVIPSQNSVLYTAVVSIYADGRV